MMPRKRWIKLWTQETLYGTTSDELKLDEQAIWTKVLCLAGDSPEPGKIVIAPGVPPSDEQIAAIFKCPLDVWLKTKQRLRDPDVDKITINEGIIHIKNWEKYQRVFDRAEYMRHYMRNYRESKTGGKTNSKQVNSKTVYTEQNRSEEEKEEEEKEGERGRGNIPGSPPSAPGSKTSPSLTGSPLFDYLIATFPQAFGRKPDSRETAQLRDLGKEISSAGGAAAKQVHDAFKEAATHNKCSISYVRAILLDWLGLEK